MKTSKLIWLALGVSLIFNAYFFSKIAMRKYQLYTYEDPKVEIAPYLIDSNAVRYNKDRDKYYDTLPLQNQANIFIGDSHIQNFPTQLLFKNPQNVNRGINSDVSLGVLHRLDKILASKPARIFIEIGVNDLMNGLPVNQLLVHYEKIVKRIITESPDTKIYVLSILPTSWYISNTQTALQFPILLVNEELAKMKNVTYINLYDSLVDDVGALNKKYDSGDRLHLNYIGYEIITEQFKPYLE